MPPTLVYLIPEDFWGAVFVFFDQPDGQELQPDSLGRSVNVPENGVVKIREPASTAVGRSMPPSHRAEQWVIVSKEGNRRVLKFFAGSYWRNVTDENRWEGYIDENNQSHEFVSDPDGRGPFYYMSEALKKERMVFGKALCADQFPLINGKATACGSFLIVSPNARVVLPEWEWDDLHGPQNPIPEFVREANERLAKRKAIDVMTQ